MDREAKAKVISDFLQKAAGSLGSRMLSLETLFAGVEHYIKEWNPPEKPFDPLRDAPRNEEGSLTDLVGLLKSRKT